MKKRILYTCIICGAVILCAVAGFFIYKGSTSEKSIVHFKCPEDYAENDAGTAEYKENMISWTSEFFKAHPGATMSDWAMAKSQLWADNKCVVAIQRSKMSGKVADLKPYELVDYGIQKALTDATKTPFYISILGFSFNYPKDMFVQDSSDGADDNYQLLVIPNSYKEDGNQDLTAVVISASLNGPSQTPLKWLNGPDSGADMSKGYTKINLDGQEAISLENGKWVVVDTPDNKYQISIATLPGDNPSQILQDEMSGIIKSFSFR